TPRRDLRASPLRRCGGFRSRHRRLFASGIRRPRRDLADGDGGGDQLTQGAAPRSEIRNRSPQIQSRRMKKFAILAALTFLAGFLHSQESAPLWPEGKTPYTLPI